MDPTNPITLLIPLIGIALILAAVWLTGGAGRARLDRALALRRLAEDLPGFAAGEIAIAADGSTALAASEDGSAFALVFAAGGKVAVRRLGRAEVRSVTITGDGLVIDTDDFAHGRFELGLPGDAERWARRLVLGERAA